MQGKPRLTQRVMDGLTVLEWIARVAEEEERLAVANYAQRQKVVAATVWLTRMRSWRKRQRGG